MLNAMYPECSFFIICPESPATNRQKIVYIPITPFSLQVSFSYRRNKNEWNVVKVDGFDTQKDPTRIYSLHCHLFPYLRFCAAATTAAKKIVIRAR